MTEADAWAIEACVAAYPAKWRQIARASEGDHDVDVASTARMQCYEWASVATYPLDWGDPELVDRFMAYLYNHLIQFTEKTQRSAVRFDHAPPGSDFDQHPLAGRLTAASGDPVSQLIAAEELQDDRKLVERAHSLAAAYVRLARHFRNDVRALADYLLISPSWTYRRLQHARTLTERQAAIPFRPSRRKLPLPRPWRSHRMQRVPQQLVLDFDSESLLSS